MGTFSWERFRKVPIIGILRGFAVDEVKPLLEACLKAGLLNVEVTMNSKDPVKQIQAAVKDFQQEMNIGAGTITGISELEKALGAGAGFIITPALFPEVITECKKRKVPIFSGAFSPTEIFTTWKLGADIVKVFPASDLGPTYFKDIRAPFPEIPLMPTGGVSPKTLVEFARAGACAFSVGSQLFDRARVEAKDWAWIERRAEEFVSSYQKAKAA